MDVGITIRTQAPATQAIARTDVAPASPQSTPTDLPAEKTVTPATTGDAIRYDLSDSARRLQKAAEALRQAVDRNLETDPRTRELVLKVTSRSTGQVVQQIPDEQQLKLRAYIRSMMAKDSGGQHTGDLVAKTA
jgi:uncharacterized FlaG/YvyC family protein